MVSVWLMLHWPYGHTVMDIIKNHNQCVKHTYSDKSVLTQHSMKTGEKIHFDTTAAESSKSTVSWDRIDRESIEICLEKHILNRNG